MEEYIKDLTPEEQESLGLSWDEGTERQLLRLYPPEINERSFPKDRKWNNEFFYCAQLSNDIFYLLRKRKKHGIFHIGDVMTFERNKVLLRLVIKKIFLSSFSLSAICFSVQVDIDQ